MNVLFLTLVEINSINDRGIYHDLLRKFRDEGHAVTIVNPVERKYGKATHLHIKDGINFLNVRTLNIQKTNFLEKGFATLSIEFVFKSVIKKYLSDVKFDLILYSTPPVTFASVVKYVKNRDEAVSYLLLKDIFPQNAVDLKIITKNSFLHKFFRRKEKNLYRISDYIGCMSPANKAYLLRHNPELQQNKVEVNPNSVTPQKFSFTDESTIETRKKYNLPLNKKIFVYGGNLGKPQGLSFLLETIAESNLPDVYFLIVGSGTEYEKIKVWMQGQKPANAKLIKSLPKDEYDRLLAACNVGLIFLHPNFTIPNFPSRLLSYLELKLPVITATDANTDIGSIIEDAACGFAVQSGDISHMLETIQKLAADPKLEKQMGRNAVELLNRCYTTDISYRLIMDKLS